MEENEITIPDGRRLKLVCCGGKPMLHDTAINQLQNDEVEEWVCLECGAFIRLVQGQYDEEDLEDIKENLLEE